MNEYRVDIFNDQTRELVRQCRGPTTAGACPFADREGVVACAGRRIVATSTGPERWLSPVSPRARRCPLAGSWTVVGHGR